MRLPGKPPAEGNVTNTVCDNLTKKTRLDSLLEDLFSPKTPEKSHTPSPSRDDGFLDLGFLQIQFSPLKMTPPASPRSLTTPRSREKAASVFLESLNEGIAFEPWRLY